jgi:hypothetical protein
MDLGKENLYLLMEAHLSVYRDKFRNYLQPILAALLADNIARWTPSYTDKTWMVFLMTIILYVFMLGVTWVVEKVTRNSVGVKMCLFLKMVLGFMMPRYLISLFSEAMEFWPIPPWYGMIPVVCVLLIVVVITLSDFLGETMEIFASNKKDAYDEKHRRTMVGAAVTATG